MVFVHAERPADLQFRWIQRRAGRLRVGLALLRVHRVSGVARCRRARSGGNRVAPARLAVLAAGMPPHASTPLFDVPTSPGMETVVIPAGAPIDETIAAVAAAEPTHLVGYATVVGQLARASLAGRLDIRPVRVSTNSEPLLDEDRQAIREAWNAPVHNLWGSTEIGVQAVGCARGEGLHVCEDEVVLERVDESGAPVGPTSRPPERSPPAWPTAPSRSSAMTLVTKSTGCPVQCACGSAFARVADIGGRRDDDFRYDTCHDPGQRVPPRPRHGSPRLRVPGASDRPRRRRSHRGGRPTRMRWRRRWSPRCAGTGCPIPRSTSASSTGCSATRQPGS